MTAKKTSTTAKAEIQKTAAELKADEVAAMMGDDAETSAPAKPTAPPTLKGAVKSEPEAEAEEKAAEKTEDQAEPLVQTDTEEPDESDNQDDDLEEDESGDEQAEFQRAKVGHMVIVTKTIHTKDSDGNDVKFIASEDPQDLGEYAEMAIKAKCAKPHKAG